MKLISVYVTVGAISFVKCEFRYDSVLPVQNRQIHKGMAAPGDNPMGHWSNFPGEWDARRHEPTEGEFSQVFGQMKSIYAQCQTKVNKRLKSILKGKVSSRLSELKAYVLSMYQCVKVLSFRALDDTLQEDFIPITDYAYFVRDGLNVTEEEQQQPTGRKHSGPLKDFAARVLRQEWPALLSGWFDNLLKTHSLKFRLDTSLVAQGRGRRRDHRMFAMMVMGFMIMASILIPMGFQFLTVLGGKSLLLAKMALIMSAINGLKKIATSNVGYGFYHTGSDGHHHDHVHHGFHEKHYHVNPQNYNTQGYN